ncbi:MAG TPA: hypothetical protein VH042_06830 [Solirubrobacterales bacterium]|nr:hypothetical protein [Solirubrobacterales bacterium]
MKRLTKKLTFANVMSVTAVFIALGGSAVAVTQLPENSVGAKQIKAGAVRSAEVKDFSLQANDFAKGTLLKGDKGDKGEQGPAGQAGSPGTPGAPATRIYAFVRTGGCCGGAPALNPPQIINGHGVTAAKINGAGQYEVTFDTSLLPSGGVAQCAPLVSEGSQDAAFPIDGEISVGHPVGIPTDSLLVLFRNSAGALEELNSGGGSDGFSIALFC